MTKKNKDTKAEEVTPLPTRKEKEYELDALLSAEEQDAYDKLDKKKMSDQGPTAPEELLEAGKKIYRKGKKAVGKIVEGAKKMLSGDKEEK